MTTLITMDQVPAADRVDFVRSVFPLAVPEIATALVAMSGLALMLLSRGVRKGQRLAWLVSVAILGASAVLHLLKAADVEEGLAGGELDRAVDRLPAFAAAR